MTPRRPALIFDFGNVVAFFDYAIACESYGRRLGLSGAEFLALLRERGLMRVVHAFEIGATPAEEFTRAVGRLAGLELDHDEFCSAWAEIFTLNRPVADLVAVLKARGYPLVLGSNTNEVHARRFLVQFAETLGLFDRLVLSYEVRRLKPSPEFYLACADAAGSPPSECVFIDDMLENVDGARRAGLKAVHYVGTPALVSELRALGVEVNLPSS